MSRTSRSDQHIERASTDVVRAAWNAVATLRGATREYPFGPDYDVAKIGGKIFMMTTAVPGKPVVTVKCEPDRAAALRGAHPSIVVGYHMNKRHWISICVGPDVTDQLVAELVTDAYDLVQDALPQTRRA